MSTKGATLLPPGRHYAARLSGKKGRCPSCDARLVYGNPHTVDRWSLNLTQKQINQLLLAAAEFDAFHEDMLRQALRYDTEPPERASAVEFVDWMTPDILEGAA